MKAFLQITVHSPKRTYGVMRREMGKFNFPLSVCVVVVTKAEMKGSVNLKKNTLLLLIIYLRDMTQCVNNTSRV